MRLRTQTRPNHEDGVRDHVWGLDVIGPLTGLFALGLTMVGMGLSFANHMDDRITGMQRDLTSTKTTAQGTADELNRRSLEAEAIHVFLRDDYVTKERFNHHNHAGRVPPEGGP